MNILFRYIIPSLLVTNTQLFLQSRAPEQYTCWTPLS